MEDNIEVIPVSTQEDYEKCLEIRRKVYIDEKNIPTRIANDIHDNLSLCFLAKLDGKAVGTSRFRIKGSFLRFERIATLEEVRGKGVGKAILAKMQEEGFRLYPEYLKILDALHSAVSFYQKLGWITVGEEFFERDTRWFVMIDPPKSKEELKRLKCLDDPDAPQPILDALYPLLKSESN